MKTVIQKWGNSQAIRLPKPILELVKLKESDPVELKVYDGKILIVPEKGHRSLKDRIASFDGELDAQEWDTKSTKDNEVL
ncbi:AbrB/MazE/SpoVT family DNA-binding domain-containing protein [Saliterribacillus persicus]|uniref:Antitoxin MazE n=1 Tax=Saliterribacillus persicus TaxID=930114 RepID=A0A368Y9S6_9BACI|nr:AbrB/MazE/SpoVT family DNA-binding domain-containing protein [Saliterribacillus persicus]RCW74944.1 antitoxin MazE [Saliterribacillus persicus]